MLFEFVGGPKDGATEEMPSRQTVAYVVREDAAFLYSREAARFVFDRQVTVDEYRHETRAWGWQDGDGMPWPPTDDEMFGENGPLLTFYE